VEMQEYLALPLHEVRNRECLSVHSASAYSEYNTLVDVTILYAPIFTRAPGPRFKSVLKGGASKVNLALA
jgi:hypothetical protein